MASGFKLRGHTKFAGMTNFEFEQTEALLDAVRNYYACRSSVEPLSLGNFMRTLKSIIHENTNGTEQFHSPTRKAN